MLQKFLQFVATVIVIAFLGLITLAYLLYPAMMAGNGLTAAYFASGDFLWRLGGLIVVILLFGLAMKLFPKVFKLR